MKRNDLSRRDFNKLTSAALGGLVAGSMLGCGGSEPAAEKKDEKKDEKDAKDGKEEGKDGGDTDVSLMLEEPHVCRGLNTCKEKGKDGKNACAGQGTCATAEKHICHTMNKCKGQGGCVSPTDTAGINTCAQKGNCGVPLHKDAWEKARARFEKVMKDAGKEVGAAPDA